MIKIFNNIFWPLTLGAALIFTATVVFAGISRYNEEPRPIKQFDKDTCILKTQSDTLDYILEHIDKNDNGMPDDLEHGTDSIYQIILDNQKAIDEISIDLDRIHAKLDELTATR